jgi:hypothetical protein
MIVLFLKMVLIMNFDDIFSHLLFSSLFSYLFPNFRGTPADPHVTRVCRGTPVENRCHRQPLYRLSFKE